MSKKEALATELWRLWMLLHVILLPDKVQSPETGQWGRNQFFIISFFSFASSLDAKSYRFCTAFCGTNVGDAWFYVGWNMQKAFTDFSLFQLQVPARSKISLCVSSTRSPSKWVNYQTQQYAIHLFPIKLAVLLPTMQQVDKPLYIVLHFKRTFAYGVLREGLKFLLEYFT